MSMKKGDPWAPNYNNHSQKQKMELNGKGWASKKQVQSHDDVDDDGARLANDITLSDGKFYPISF